MTFSTFSPLRLNVSRMVSVSIPFGMPDLPCLSTRADAGVRHEPRCGPSEHESTGCATVTRIKTTLDATRQRDAVRALMPGLRADLERLIRIPSISHPGFDAAEVRRSAEAT